MALAPFKAAEDARIQPQAAGAALLVPYPLTSDRA